MSLFTPLLPQTFTKPLGIIPGWIYEYGHCELYLLEGLSYTSYCTQPGNENSLGTCNIRDFTSSHLKM